MDTGGDDLVGAVVDGRYRVLQRIGHGGMGAVYEVEHERIGRRFALKTLHAELATNSEMVARFHQEARAAGAIGNEHIIEVSDMGLLADGSPYIVMELLEGQDLGEVIEATGPLSVARVVRIAAQACDGLAAAHAAGIIHRDLKPENIFLVASRKQPDFVKLLDFGISKFRDVLEGLNGAPMTQTGMTMGTPYYMAPEQATASKDIDGRADVYSMGVVLFQMLTGRLPFEAPSLPALLIEIMQAHPPSICAVRPDVPAALESVLFTALAKHPDGRFATTTELARALAPFASMEGDPVVVSRVDAYGSTQTPQAFDTRPVGGAAAGGAAPTVASRVWLLGAAALPEFVRASEQGRETQG